MSPGHSDRLAMYAVSILHGAHLMCLRAFSTDFEYSGQKFYPASKDPNPKAEWERAGVSKTKVGQLQHLSYLAKVGAPLVPLAARGLLGAAAGQSTTGPAHIR